MLDLLQVLPFNEQIHHKKNNMVLGGNGERLKQVVEFVGVNLTCGESVGTTK